MCDTSTMAPRPFLPEATRRPIFHQLHSLAHPGIKSTIRLISSRFMWPSMAKDIKSWVKECQQCQASKIGRHTKTGLKEMEFPTSNRFEVVHMDIVGPLPPSSSLCGHHQGMRYLVSFIDRTKRWCEVQPISNIEAETMATTFVGCSIWCIFVRCE